MKEKVLIVVDVQKGFINENNKHIIETIDKLSCSNAFSEVIATKFVNKSGSLFFDRLNWQKMTNVNETDFCFTLPKNCKITEKTTYALPTRELKNLKKTLKNKDVYLCGVDYCCCVLALCFQLFDMDVPINIVWDAVEACSVHHVPKEEMKVLYERTFGKGSIVSSNDLID